jgi:predicted nucleic acid-binding protein
VTIDASFLIALCAREPDKYPKAYSQLGQYVHAGCQFFAPGVLVAEVLFVLCRKLMDGSLTPTEHAQAVQSLVVYLRAIAPPPRGDAALAARAEQLRGTYGCSHSADGLYLALAEELATLGTAELVTFDVGLQKQAAKHAPTVAVRLLIP